MLKKIIKNCKTTNKNMINLPILKHPPTTFLNGERFPTLQEFYLNRSSYNYNTTTNEWMSKINDSDEVFKIVHNSATDINPREIKIPRMQQSNIFSLW